MATPIVWSSELPVNTTTQGTQNDPSIVALAGGGFVVTWSDFSQTGGDTSGAAVRAQLFHADGSKLGGEFLVNTTTADSQHGPDVFALPGGGFVVAWQNGQVAAQDSIRAHIFNAHGDRVGGELMASTTTAGFQRSAAGTAFANGQFLIAWQDSSGMGDSSGWGIRAHVFNANGSKATPEFQVNSTTVSDQTSPAVATLTNGHVVVAWTDQSGTGGDTSDNAVRARLFDIDGEPLGADFVVNTTTQGAQFRPSVTALADGRFVVSWIDISMTGSDTSSFAVRAQVFNADGSRFGSEFLVNTTTESAQQVPALTALADGRFVAVWENVLVEFATSDIRAQVFNPDGTRSGDEFIVGTQEGLTRKSPTVAALADGRFAVSFISGPTGDVPADVAVQIFDPREGPVDFGGSPLDDDLVGTRFDDQIGGNDGNDRLQGGDGNDFLFGDFGADMLDGGAGIDTVYYVDSPVGVVARLTGGSFFGYADGDTFLNVENLHGSAFQDLLVGDNNNNILDGHDGDDNLLGGAGNDVLISNHGKDQLSGGLGDDTYYVENSGDVVFEEENEGADTVISLISYTLGLSVENLVLYPGIGAINGTGNALANVITGNAGANLLDGAGGDDALNGMAGANILTGGAGADTFRFDASAFDGMKDWITDYSFAENDVIDLSSFVSTDPANLSSFVQVLQSNGKALLAVDRDGTGSTYGWETIARIDNVNVGHDIRLLIGPSSTQMTVAAVVNPATIAAYTDTLFDTQNQQAWSRFDATYNSSNQPLYFNVDYDDGTHSATIYDAADVELHSDLLVTYNTGWQVTRIIFNYDDGTHSVGSYDVANEYSYTDYLATFDSQWNLTRNIFNNDDGTHSVVNYDVQDQYDWAFEVFEYDANWGLLSRHGQNDDGSTFGNGYVGNGDEAAGFSGDQSQGLPAWFGALDESLSPSSVVGDVENLTFTRTDNDNASFNVSRVNGNAIEDDPAIDTATLAGGPDRTADVVAGQDLWASAFELASAGPAADVGVEIVKDTIHFHHNVGPIGANEWIVG